ncbi:hypothetical protein AA3250_2682 [Gluconobacter albidus NBRC 3250]|nr:hypothetical protein AA3250_2682 [Gluconobacter albidus NBRC 3250]
MDVFTAQPEDQNDENEPDRPKNPVQCPERPSERRVIRKAPHGSDIWLNPGKPEQQNTFDPRKQQEGQPGARRPHPERHHRRADGLSQKMKGEKKPQGPQLAPVECGLKIRRNLCRPEEQVFPQTGGTDAIENPK